MGLSTFLNHDISFKIVKVAVCLVLGVLGFLIWHFAFATMDGNWKTFNEVVFESPNYPEMHTASTTILKFFVNKQFAGIKITFYDWDMQVQDFANSTEDSDEELTTCEKFSIHFKGFNLRNAEEICGSLKGYTILVDRSLNSEGMQALEIRVQNGEKGLKCKWKFKVSQISAVELHYKTKYGNKSRKRRQSLLWENEEENEILQLLETPLIAHGWRTYLENVPWQVSIRDMTKPPVFADLRHCSPTVGRHFCAGSLISGNLVLSAAHCFYSSGSEFRSLSSLRAIVGQSSTCLTSDQNETVQSHEIQSVYVHYGFDINTYMNDIVLIKLKTSVVFNERVMPIELSTEEAENISGKIAYMTGWGRTILTSPESHSDTLRLGKVILQSNEFCTKEYPDISIANKHLRKSILCSRLSSSTSSSGKGDSGGGLYTAESNLIGVISFIVRGNNMSYFQSVTFFQNWIQLAIHF